MLEVLPRRSCLLQALGKVLVAFWGPSARPSEGAETMKWSSIMVTVCSLLLLSCGGDDAGTRPSIDGFITQLTTSWWDRYDGEEYGRFFEDGTLHWIYNDDYDECNQGTYEVEETNDFIKQKYGINHTILWKSSSARQARLYYAQIVDLGYAKRLDMSADPEDMVEPADGRSLESIDEPPARVLEACQ